MGIKQVRPLPHKKKILDMCATPYQHRLAGWGGKLSTPAEGNIDQYICVRTCALLGLHGRMASYGVNVGPR